MPLVHWVVLASTGTSLLLGFTLVSLGVRSPHAFISRVLFSALVGALLTVARLLSELATPFDAGSSYSAAGEVRGAHIMREFGSFEHAWVCGGLIRMWRAGGARDHRSDAAADRGSPRALRRTAARDCALGAHGGGGCGAGGR